MKGKQEKENEYNSPFSSSFKIHHAFMRDAAHNSRDDDDDYAYIYIIS